MKAVGRSDPRRHGARVVERAKCIAEQTLDLPETFCREVATPTERIQCCAKEIGRTACPHRFPMLGDSRYGECAQSAGSTFAGSRVSEPLRLGAHPGVLWCLPGACFGTKGSQVQILSCLPDQQALGVASVSGSSEGIFFFAFARVPTGSPSCGVVGAGRRVLT